MRRLILVFLLGPLLVFGKNNFEFELFVDGVIGIIHLNSFNEDEAKETFFELKALGPLKGIVLDLRSNTDGVLVQAVKVLEAFSQKETPPLRVFQIPVVILTPKTLSPAVEIVCRSLQESKRAVIFNDEMDRLELKNESILTGLEKIGKNQIFVAWQKTVSQLVENSSLRRKGDRNWQNLAEGKLEKCGSEDLQKREAINILKDMVCILK